MKLTINADDFGISHSINKAVKECFCSGVVNSASFVVNGEKFNEAVKILENHPRLGRGLHVNFTEGKPVSDPNNIPTLVDKKGEFYRKGYRFFLAYFLGRIRLEDIKKELEAQLDKAENKVSEIDHINSHHHIHAIPEIFQRFSDKAEQRDINHVRVPYEPFIKRILYESSRVSYVFQRGFINNLSLWLIIHTKPEKYQKFNNTRFYGILDCFDAKKILEKIEKQRIERAEIAVHPGVEGKRKKDYEACKNFEPGRKVELYTF